MLPRLVLCLVFFATTIHFAVGQVLVEVVNTTDNVIWSTTNNSIIQWDLDLPDSLVIDTIVGFGTYESLAISHIKINNDTTLNTYISADRSSGIFRYWHDDNWVNFDTLPYLVLGIGGYEDDLYLKLHFSIYHFDGESLVSLPLPDDQTSTGADIAVDNLGRAWYLSGEDFPEYLSDSIHVIDRDGTSIADYPLSSVIYGYGTYGMAIVKDTIYVGMGSSNLTFPNKIVAIVIEDGVAKITDKVIDMSNHKYRLSDLASNDPGNPMAITNSIYEEAAKAPLLTYPNPASHTVTIQGEILFPAKASIYAINGTFLTDYQVDQMPYVIDIRNLASGAYLLECQNTRSIFIKM